MKNEMNEMDDKIYGQIDDSIGLSNKHTKYMIPA